MIHVTIIHDGKTYQVGDFENAEVGFKFADKMAAGRGWKQYRKSFEYVDREETIAF